MKRETNIPTLPSEASMNEMIDALWKLPRDLVSDGYDLALEALSTQLPIKIHEYPTGTECWTWTVPEKWTCHEAYLETISGERLFSYEDNPLHEVSYSLPFEGIVTRSQLFDHLYVHPKIREAIPYKFKFYERDWGLCCSSVMKESLTDDQYKVVIKTSFNKGSLKIGEVVVRGASEDTVVLAAHLDHPAMVSDDLSGVVVGLDVMRKLLKLEDLRFTYRFLILPETIGSAAYLSQNENLIPKIKGGLFLEMLSLPNPLALQLSFAGDTEIDRCFTTAINESSEDGWIGAFRTIVVNDERQFNAPGVRVPMLSLSRSLPRSNPAWPYKEYHSNYDDPKLVSEHSLQSSRDMVLNMIGIFEGNRLPVNKFKGEIFMSRFGLHIDLHDDPEGHKALFGVMYLVDGTRTVAEISETCGVPFDTTKKIVDELYRCDLVEYIDAGNRNAN